MLLIMLLGLFIYSPNGSSQDQLFDSQTTKLVESEKVLIESEDSIIDSTHKRLSSSLFYFSNQIDSFFGGDRADDLPNASRLRFLMNFNKEESSDYKSKGSLKLNIALVETQKKLKFSLKNQYEKKHETSEVKTQTDADLKESEKDVSALDNFLDLFRWRLRLDSGIQLDFPPDPFLRLSAIKSWNFGTYELRAAQQIFYYIKSKGGETSKLDLDHPINENILFRYENEATWTDATDRFTFFSGPIVYQKISDERGISYNAKILGESKPKWFVNDYKMELTYRRAVFRKWFFMELNPYIHFPKVRNWESALGFNIRFELVVGSY